ncbi:MAG TPA: methyltransferase domain-containing protein [Terriglobales bacterium]|nr:methyltransferase domain-containing protein [Terriglobales bacterium]
MATKEKWDAELYDGKHAFVWELAKDLVPLLEPKAGERILDIGCGTGHLTAEIATSGAEVVGIDRSEEMIAEARKKFPELRFEVKDAKELEFAEEFDAVFSNATLHWIGEPERVIEGIARALRPGGRFVAEFGGEGNIAKLIAALHRACKKLGMEFSEEMQPWYFPSVAEYAGLLEKHGLEVRQGALFDRPTPLEDGERGLRVWMEMFGGAILKQVPEEKRAALLEGTKRAAREELFREGRWVLDYRRLRIVAQRA